MTATAAKLAKGTTPATGPSPQTKFTAMQTDMNAGLIERDGEIDVALTALVSNHNPLFVGDPGTAKSMLGRAIAGWLDGTQYEVLLSKFTDPAELFGPVSIEGLKRDEYRRITDATMLDCEVAFVDEVFKGSTAILNTMLGVFNERRYRNGKTWINCPLVMAIAASNEWPQDSETGGKELGALFDRFLYRKVVKPVRSPEGQDKLLWAPKLAVTPTTKITPAEIALARSEAMALAYADEAKDGFVEILAKLEDEGINPGDRRKRWSVEACKAYAYLHGASEVGKDHLEILTHTLWVVPTADHMDKTAQVVAKVANPLGMKVNELLAEAREAYKSANNGRDLKAAIAACAKLKEVMGTLAPLAKGNTKAASVLKHVQGLNATLRVAMMEKID